mmetsp:Transcript_8131/g.14718  ORF Transcript_8131/g.14718 Transcript_8131/m.14718 type:complete len:219 (+) Transcript_8131:756-1412(+)
MTESRDGVDLEGMPWGMIGIVLTMATNHPLTMAALVLAAPFPFQAICPRHPLHRACPIMISRGGTMKIPTWKMVWISKEDKKRGGGEIVEDDDAEGIIVVEMWIAGLRSMIVSLLVEEVVNIIWIPWMMSTCRGACRSHPPPLVDKERDLPTNTTKTTYSITMMENISMSNQSTPPNKTSIWHVELPNHDGDDRGKNEPSKWTVSRPVAQWHGVPMAK